jgi:hypothetical protein
MGSIDENLSIYDMSSQGRVLNLKTTIPLTPYIYVATTAGGVYFTDDYVNETVQPIWVDVSAGLGELTCKEFHIDPIDPKDRQYVLTTANILYRRVGGGNWEVILTLAIASTAAGCSAVDSMISGFCLDPLIPGRMWATFGSNNVVEEPDGFWALYSDDYGDNWTAILLYHGINTYSISSPVVYDDVIHIPMGIFAGGAVYDYCSKAGGIDFGPADTRLSAGSWLHQISWNPTDDPYKIYYFGNRGGAPTTGIHSLEVGAWDVANSHWDDIEVFLDVDIYPLRLDSMWFDPTDALHQRAIHDTTDGLFTTTDGWTTHSAILNTLPVIICLNPVDVNGEMIVGMVLNHGLHYHHCVGVMTNETDAAPVGIAGTNCDTAPFTDSIPDTIGAICQCGVQAFMA